MDEIELLIQEYDSLRKEIITTLEVRNSILSFGLATIGIIFTAGIAFLELGPLVAGLVFSIVIPFICVFVLFIWLGEYQRMQRAGKFVAQLENRINQVKGKEILSWEISLRAKRTHMKYPYNSTVLLLILIAVFSTTVGVIIINLIQTATIILIGSAILLYLVMYRYVMLNIEKLRE